MTYVVEGEWLVEVVGEHTCGAGADGYGHEPGCGMVPIGKVEDLLNDSATLVKVRIAMDERGLYDGVRLVKVRRLLEPAEDCCGHTAAQHGLHRCMALLDSGEPCPCTKGYKP